MTTPHSQLGALTRLLGTWSGGGHGDYPTIEAFDYREEVVFGHVGKPFLTYRQRTWAVDDERPLHAETGYLRAIGGDRIELVLAHPTGVAEIAEGTVRLDGDALLLDLPATRLAATGTAKEVTALARRIRVDGDRLGYTVDLGAVGLSLQPHLSATLDRNSSAASAG